MDAMRSSSKRKQPSSSTSRGLLGIITRSKASLFLHENRTHNLRSDWGRTKGIHYSLHSSNTACRSETVQYASDDDDDMLLISDLCKKAKLKKESSIRDDDEPSPLLIKDLRARRVYSPQSVAGSFSNSTQNVYPKEPKVGSSCRDQRMADSGFGSASNAENSGRGGEDSKRDGEINNLGEGFPSEGRTKDEINSILCSIIKEYRSDRDSDLYFDDAMGTRNEETESLDVGFAYKTQNLDHVNHESLGESKILQYFNDGNDGRGTSERIDDLNEVPKLTTPPEIEICGKSEINEDEGKIEGIHDKDTQLTENTEENAEGVFYPKADKKDDSVLKRKSVLRPRLQRKLFRTPGSVSYRRMLPFLINIAKDDSGPTKLGHCQSDGKVIDAKKFQFPLSPQSQEVSKDLFKTDSCTVHGAVESRTLVDNNDLSNGNEPKLTPYQDLRESPMQLDAIEVAHDCSFVPSLNEHIENVEISLKHKCLSNTKADPAVDFRCVRDVANDDFKQDSNDCNSHGDNAEANDGGGTTQQICVLMNPPDSDPCGNSQVSEDEENQVESIPYNINHKVKSMDLTRNAQENAGEGFCPEPTKRNDHVLESKSVLKPCLQRKLFNRPGSVSYRRLLPFLMDITKNNSGSHANIRSDALVSNEEPRSPSDTMILEKSEMVDNEVYTAKIAPEGKVYGQRTSSKGSSNNNAHFAGKVREKGFESKTTLPSIIQLKVVIDPSHVINPSLRIKLLKHSGSFNYRRLLPYLQNITKDNSCATTNDHYPKLEKSFDQAPPPIPALDYQVTPMNDPNGCVFPMEHFTGNSGTPQNAVEPGPDDSLNNSSSTIISSAHSPESQSSHDSRKLIQLQDERVLFNGDSKLESSPDLPISVARIDSPITPSCPIINKVITGEEDATSASHQLSVNSEVKGNSSFNEEKSLNTDGCQKLCQSKALEKLTVLAVGFNKKGILKRNPRGCRGLCTCLNCASFRLHAERAFEFSRNQLLDAEEVTMDLMKELSHLRNMLERSTDGANDHSVLDENQVKEACRKAFAAEELAKDRLSQMNDDLNIHSRIPCLQQPRVRFANYIEEKVIPQAGFPGKNSTEIEPLGKTDK